jgi:cell division protein FtsB
LIWVVAIGLIVWGVWAFTSELLVNVRLNSEVEALRAANAQLASSNAQTRDELKTANSNAALEEAARKQGFTRPGEQVYVIVSPNASQAQNGGNAAAASAGGRGIGDNLWKAISNWWNGLWRKGGRN